MNVFVIAILVSMVQHIDSAESENISNPYCSSPTTCEYFYDINNPVSCSCSKNCTSNGLRKLCFYTSQLKINCDSSCNSTRLESACGNLCCHRDCKPNNWKEWGLCKGPCGGRTGTRYRIRTVDPNQMTQCGGAACPSLQDTETCLTDCCPINCQWSQWSQWSKCNNTCGDGFNIKTRAYFRESSCGGKNCTGESLELKPCTQFKNVDCVMDSWSEWGDCKLFNRICGNGKQNHTRNIIKQSSCLGLPCSNTIETRPCTGTCCKQDCLMKQWSPWSFCNVTCGVGTQTRTTRVLTPGLCGGTLCPTDLVETASCNKTTFRNCSVTEWSDWTTCSNSCGIGYYTGQRWITLDEACGGSCFLSLFRNQTCESYSANQNCQVSPWSEWSNCFKDCNLGQKYKTRTITKLAVCRGLPCPTLQDNSTCLQPCSQLCNNGLCSCYHGYVLSNDSINCQSVSCNQLPNVTFDLPNLQRTVDYDYVTYNCAKDLIEAGDVCTVSCSNKNWVLRGNVENYTCHNNGQFNYQKMYCGTSNYPPTDILLDNSKAPEIISNSQCFGILSTTDANGLMDSFVYLLLDNFQNRLKIMGNQLCLNKYTPDYEAPYHTWKILVKTTDSGNLSFEKWLNISILDLNDPASSCRLDRDNSIPENIGQPYLIGYLIITDRDSNPGLSYPSILDSDSSNFELIFDSTQPVFKYGLQVSTVLSSQCLERGGEFCDLNFEIANTHTISIQVTDAGVPPASSYFNIKVKLLDRNDAPSLVYINITELSEDTNPGLIIAQLNILDEDNATQSYTYEMVNSTSNYFSIDSSGNLILTQAINYEDSTLQTLEIYATGIDNGIPPMNVTSLITIAITDVSEPPNILMVSNSQLNGNVYYLRILENNEIGDKIATIFINDPDINDTVSFMISDNTNIRILDNDCTTTVLQVSSTNCQVDLFSLISFDHEKANVIPFNFTLIDSTNLTTNYQFLLQIEDMNEIPKNIKFDITNSTTIRIKENLIGVNISLLQADDIEINSKLTYTIIENSGGNFEIINDNMIKLKNLKFLDFEGDTNLNRILVEVKDNGIPPRSSEMNLTIYAIDINEKPQNILLSNNTISENAKAGSVVGLLSAIDQDYNENFTFIIISTTNEVFQIFGNALIIKESNSSQLNFESTPIEVITIKVLDKGFLTFVKSFQIIVLNSNDAPSNLSITNNFVFENRPIGTVVGNIMCFDEDINQTSSYILESNKDLFEILSYSSLTVKATLNYEEKSEYDLLILYYDNGDPQITSTSVLSIYIVDVNENPYFESVDPILLYIPENSINTLGTITAIDPDLNEELHFNCICLNTLNITCPLILTKTTCINSNILNSTICTIDIAVLSPLNYEDLSIYHMQIQVQDGKGQISNLNATLIVEDVNEPITVILLNGMPIKPIKLKENVQGIIIGQLSILDEDTNQNHDVKIYNTDSSVNFLQIINQTIQTLGDFSFNFEEQSLHNVTLQITDNSSNPIVTYLSLIIIVDNVNEAPTNIILTNNQIIENIINGTIIANLSTSDPDNIKETIQNFSYFILDKDEDKFVISNSQLKINNSSKINYEQSKTVEIIIKVFDNGIPPLSFNQVFIFSILDSNDCPKDIRLSDALIGKNDPINTIVKNISIDDEDEDQTYFINIINVTPLMYTSFFCLNIENQLVKCVNHSIEVSNINITILVTDSGTPPMNGTINFAINIVDKIANCQSIIYWNPNFVENEKLVENSTINSNIGYLIFQENSNATIKFIKPLNEESNSYFHYNNLNCSKTIQGDSCSFEIELQKKLDYETKRKIDIELELFFIDDSACSFAQVVDIANINEGPTDILCTSDNITIENNLPRDEYICYFTAVGIDNDDKVRFEMLSRTEGISLLENGLLTTNGKEMQLTSSLYTSILIKVTDKYGLSFKKSFPLTIVVKNNKPPQSININAINIFDNATNDQIICDLIVTEPSQNNSYKFSISFNNRNNFKINNNKLMININQDSCIQFGLACEFNNQLKSSKNITINIKATDIEDPSLSKEFTIFIYIINSHIPTDIILSSSRIDENLPINSVVGTLTIINQERSDIFQCLETTNSPFYVDLDLLLKTNISFNFENISLYEIIINCSYNDKFISRPFQIKINNLNENPNLISTNKSKDQNFLNTFENIHKGSVIGFIYSFDPDLNEILNFQIDSPNVQCENITCSSDEFFGSICQSTIIVKDDSNFNFEINNYLLFNVTVFDKNQKNLNKLIKIIINDVEEDPTDILVEDSTDKYIYIEENSNSHMIGHLTSDNKNPNDSYNFRILSDLFKIFIILKDTQLWIAPSAIIDYETNSEYSIVIGLFENDLKLLSKTFFVYIENKNEPPIGLVLSNSKIVENCLNNSIIGSLIIDDPDQSKENQSFTFQLLTYNHTFYISNSQIKVQENQNIDFEKISSYNLSILVTDSGSPPLSSIFYVILQIQDVNELPENFLLIGEDIYENMAIGTFIGRFHTDDEDQNSILSYSLVNESKFTISNNLLLSGIIFNYEICNNYSINVTVTDNGSPSLKITEQFIIFIKNQNEKPEIVVKNANGENTNRLNIMENNKPGEMVGLITITDPDINDNISYKIVPDNIGFIMKKISESDYYLYINYSTNYEELSVIKFSILVHDGNNMQQSTNIIFNVLDINEPPKNIMIDGSDQTNISIRENVKGLLLVACLIVNDPDNNDNIIFVINKCDNCEEKFHFPNNGSKLYLNEQQSFDYESNIGKEVNIYVTATDSGNLSISLIISVNITDINEPPQIHGVTFLEIDRYTLSNNTLGEVNVTDEDLLPENNQISCFIINYIDWLTIQQVEKTIFIKTKSSKFIKDISIVLNIQCSDNGNPSLVSNNNGIFVNVVDGGDEPLILSFKWINESVYENVDNITLGQLILFTEYSNKYVQIKTENISIQSTEKVKIKINEINQFTLMNKLDYETMKTFKISFILLQNENDISIDATIKVMDVNEAPIRIYSSEVNISVFERSEANIHITTLYVDDPDSNQVHHCKILKVLISKDNLSNAFQSDLEIMKLIENNLFTDLDSSTVLNANNISGIWIDIKCEDGEQPSLSITNQIFIKLLDINYPPSAIKLEKNIQSILENYEIDSVLETFVVEDEDINDNHICNSSNDIFKISNNTIILTKSPDYEKLKKLVTTITCTDQEGLNVTLLWHINIDNVDEPPQNIVLNNDQFNETLPINVVVSNILAFDPEGYPCNFSLKFCLNMQCPFILSSSGSLILNQSLSSIKTTDVIYFVVVVSDDISNSQSSVLKMNIIRNSLVNISINLINIINIPENSTVGTEVFDIQVYFLSNTTKNIICTVFTIGDFLEIEDQKVYLGKTLDFELNNQLITNVTCYQNQYQPLKTVSITLNITNVDESIKEIITNITQSLVEGNYTNEGIGIIIVKDPEVDNTTVSCTASNVDLNFTIDSNCLIITSTGECELSFNVAITGNFDHETTENGFNFSITCSDNVSSISKLVTIRIKNKNEPPMNLIINGSSIIDLDTLKDGSIIGTLIVIDEDLFQSHNILTQSPGNKYFFINDNHEIVLQNLEYCWPGDFMCTFLVLDNGIPSLSATFNKMFHFIKSGGEIVVDNKIINVKTKATALLSEIKLKTIIAFNSISFTLVNVPDNAFQIINNQLWLIKDADQLPHANISIIIKAYNNLDNSTITKENIRLEVKGFSICQTRLNTCHQNATCSITTDLTTFTCSCNIGFTGDGKNCTEINECSENPCLGRNSVCIDMINDYQCKCESNRLGKKCEILTNSICGTIECVYGICDRNDLCICLPGWQGNSCNATIDHCLINPCHNNGICYNNFNGFHCTCENNFTGKLCEFSSQICDPCNITDSTCITLNNGMPYCLNHNDIGSIIININDNLIQHYPQYQNDFSIFLAGLDQFENDTIHMNITKLSEMNYQFNFTVIDQNSNIVVTSQRLDILKNECSFTVKPSSEWLICSRLFPPGMTPKQIASNLSNMIINNFKVYNLLRNGFGKISFNCFILGLIYYYCLQQLDFIVDHMFIM